MHNKIDVRGMEHDQAFTQLEQMIQAGHSGSLEILCSGKEITNELIGVLSQHGATCDVLVAEEGQTIIASFSVQSVMKQKSYIVGSDTLGKGDDVIGSKLMNAFFNVSSEYDQVPASVFFMNTGVKLCIEGAPALEALKKLAEKGTEILVCGTCLDFFGIKDKLAVGQVGTMHDLIGIYHHQTEVITL
ncbi:sulfurtransferase-like selenium metabolism protein YedF [Vibrio quintilis]|uniref:DsrE/DsrF-like family protein n=1 Tax=Vibrio quintilis TaxID=1117707 RepID=A0A1M7YZU9_9VIBR|nr:sulfurtransferase-like selenium metabolism protein YedF [Vibrio quintilis]SHO58209.1 DsrE/DsrF-like family protein [Vibrio quintilis]